MSVTPEASADKTLDQFISETAEIYFQALSLRSDDGLPFVGAVYYAKHQAAKRFSVMAQQAMAFSLIDHWAGVA